MRLPAADLKDTDDVLAGFTVPALPSGQRRGQLPVSRVYVRFKDNVGRMTHRKMKYRVCGDLSLFHFFAAIRTFHGHYLLFAVVVSCYPEF